MAADGRLLPRPLHVLVVDEHDDAAASLALLLRLHGHAALVARDVPGALALARDARPDVVLTGVVFRGVDSHDLARRLCEQAGGRGPLVIAITTRGRPDALLRSAAANIPVHLVKPVDPALLLQLLRAYAARLGKPTRA
jgi:CheY-like chemotaxis protein